MPLATMLTRALPLGNDAQVSFLILDAIHSIRRVVVKNIESSGASIYLSRNRFQRFEIAASTPVSPKGGNYYIVPDHAEDIFVITKGQALYALSDIKPGQIQVQSFPIESIRDMDVLY